jgi:nitrite reductase/ring-hydroxylating ferredoxin subunit
LGKIFRAAALMSRQTIFEIPASALRPGQARGFEWREAASAGGRHRMGFLAKVGADEFVAYENECPHLGVPLDAGCGEFFEEEGRFLVCSLHGALFIPKTGDCVAGPCRGDSLRPLAIERRGERVAVFDPKPGARREGRIA